MPPTKSVRTLSLPVAQWYAKHRRYWDACRRCDIGHFAFRHVTGRGTLPCDVLFLGEAPGVSEDSLGLPFVGRSGKVLDQLISESQLDYQSRQMELEGQDPADPDYAPAPFTYFITNTVACRPCDSGDSENRAPTEDEVKNCRGRVMEILGKAKPLGVVLVGKVAESAWERHYGRFAISGRGDGQKVRPVKTTTIYHPSYLLRRGVSHLKPPDQQPPVFHGVLRDLNRFVASL